MSCFRVHVLSLGGNLIKKFPRNFWNAFPLPTGCNCESLLKNSSVLKQCLRGILRINAGKAKSLDEPTKIKLACILKHVFLKTRCAHFGNRSKLRFLLTLSPDYCHQNFILELFKLFKSLKTPPLLVTTIRIVVWLPKI